MNIQSRSMVGLQFDVKLTILRPLRHMIETAIRVGPFASSEAARSWGEQFVQTFVYGWRSRMASNLKHTEMHTASGPAVERLFSKPQIESELVHIDHPLSLHLVVGGGEIYPVVAPFSWSSLFDVDPRVTNGIEAAYAIRDIVKDVDLARLDEV